MGKRNGSAFLKIDRRAFFGLAGAAAGLGATGAAARTAPRTAVEPALTDATANAPGYSGQPKRARRAAPADDPLQTALKG